MRNIDFSLGYLVDREKLNKYMSESSHLQQGDCEFHCLLETSFGYTGVNIKIPLTENITKMEIKKLTYQKDETWCEIWTTYKEYLQLLPTDKERNNKINEERYNTFLVFHSGKVIHSGLTADFMEKAYNYFLQIMRTGYEHIEERLD